MQRITPGERASNYISWMSFKKVVPSDRSPDPLERSLAYTYATLRSKQDRSEAEETAFREMTAARVAVREVRAEAGLPRRSFKSKGMVTALRIETFYREKGRLPLASRDDERKVYGDLRNLRHRRTVGELPADTVAVLEQIPGALAVVRRPPLPELEKLEAWCAANKRMPRHDINNRSTPEEDLEVHLGQWLYRHIHRRPSAKETDTTRTVRERIFTLQDTYPPASAVKASAEARQVLDFIDREGRLPDRHRDTLLYAQARRVRHTYTARKGRFGADIAEFLAATSELPNPAESTWDGHFAEVREFTAANGRLPLIHSGPAPERRLAEWLAVAPYVDDAGRRDALESWLEGFSAASAA
ncbi:hypothetical protein [Arthrobacter caoxuetaonis]|uniref:Uncharacterized protein n=1 Tax=Arthrobacter caoxuetaonis TaxID=2886935 RepID=A0A9X1MIW6_9MICC|nr:hypothetical protein [Arthrobacter caoxuetaonis]MCC3299782.1 hypothetical protein [Arthrobacter caoxuetaonis]USQ59317.1 hypothetical protein NF551_17185 [Arthrobacter caoxuetaonis]